jgi:hypothetical protein
VQEQRRQHHALPRLPERELRTTLEDLERAEDPESMLPPRRGRLH